MSKSRAPIWEAVDDLKERIKAVELKLETPVSAPSVVSVAPEIPVVEVVQAENYFPVPVDYVETVDLVLNKSFQIKCEPLKDSPAFIFTVTVPDKYSSLPAPHRSMGLKDDRVKVITYSDGVTGVRLWCEKVYNLFDKDTQFRITEDRPFAQRAI